MVLSSRPGYLRFDGSLQAEVSSFTSGYSQLSIQPVPHSARHFLFWSVSKILNLRNWQKRNFPQSSPVGEKWEENHHRWFRAEENLAAPVRRRDALVDVLWN